MDLQNELRNTAARFQTAHAATLQAINDEEKRTIAEVEKKLGGLSKKQEKEKAIAYNQSANKVHQISSALNDACRTLQKKDNGILTVAEYFEFGKLSFPGEKFRLNDDIDIPFFFPFFGHGNLFVSVKSDEITDASRQIAWQLLTQTAAGQLDISAFDPDLSGAMSPFSTLGKDSEILHIFSQPDELEKALFDLTKDVQQVTDMMRGTTKTLVEFRNKVRQPVGIYKLIILLDFPKNISEKAYSLLMSLLKSAPMTGISFLILQKEETAIPEYVRPQDIKKQCICLKKSAKGFIWENKNNIEAAFSFVDTQNIVKGVDELVLRIAKESAPSILFSQIEKVEDNWKHSSADGITFGLGSSGLDTMEVRLGDDKSQKHNCLISGAVGQGKSNLIKVIIHSLCSRYSPQELNLYLLDFKEGVTLYPFSNLGSPDYLPHAKVLGLESDRNYGLAVLQYLEDEFERRSKLFKKYGDNISKYRAANADNIVPRIVLIIDEFHFLFNIDDKLGQAAASTLEALARKGRSYGIHIILASQSITGADALMAKEKGVFGQFPIRIALKNNLIESEATFIQGNDAATKLRIRGQAVINFDYGALDSNQFFTVAWAPDAEFDKLRIDWWNKTKATTVPPAVFDGSHILRPSDGISEIKKLRKAVINESGYPFAIIGLPITVEQQPICIPLSDDTGRNIAILGAGENTRAGSDGDTAANSAIGILHMTAVSLALQHPNGDARFIVLNFMDKAMEQRNNQNQWVILMERLGFPVEIIEKSAVSDFLYNLTESLSERTESDEKIYIFGFGMDRAAMLLDGALEKIICKGSFQGVHVIGWWTNIESYNSQIGYDGSGFVETKIILRLDEDKTQKILNNYLISWAVKDNRALIADQTQLPEPIAVIPYSPVTQRDVQLLTTTDWS